MTKNQAVIARLSDDMSRLPTEREAIYISGLLLAAWPQRTNPDETEVRIFTRLLIELLLSYPLFICQQLASIHTGIIGKGPRFRPSISEFRMFADELVEKHQAHLDQLRDEAQSQQELLEGYNITPEERARRIEVLRATRRIIQDTAEATRRASPHVVTPVQYDGHGLDADRLAALEYVQSMSGGETMNAEDE